MVKRHRASDSFISNKLLYKTYLALGKTDKACCILKEYLRKNPLKPISLRGMFEDIYQMDKDTSLKVLSVLLKRYPEVEILEMLDEIKAENLLRENAKKSNKEIEEFYANKLKQHYEDGESRMKLKYKKLEQRIKDM